MNVNRLFTHCEQGFRQDPKKQIKKTKTPQNKMNISFLQFFCFLISYIYIEPCLTSHILFSQSWNILEENLGRVPGSGLVFKDSWQNNTHKWRAGSLTSLEEKPCFNPKRSMGLVYLLTNVLMYQKYTIHGNPRECSIILVFFLLEYFWESFSLARHHTYVFTVAQVCVSSN